MSAVSPRTASPRTASARSAGTTRLDHPNILAALAAIRAARQAWTWVADLVEPGPVDNRRTGHLTPAAAALRDELLRAERRDRVHGQRRSLQPSGTSQVPVNLTAVDVRQAALDSAIEWAWRISEALRRRRGFIATPAGLIGPSMAYGQDWLDLYTGRGAAADVRWQAATGYLLVTVHHAPQPLAGVVFRRVDATDQLLRRAAGVGPAWRTVHHDCPACGQRRIRAQTSDPEPGNWIVRCDNPQCTCRGLRCPCGQPDRAQHYGQPHWWLGRDWATRHGPLAVPIQRGNTGLWRPDGWYGRPTEIANELGIPEARVRDWLRRTTNPDDRLHGLINTYRDRGRRWARLDDCATVDFLTRNSTRGRKRTPTP